MTTQRVLVIHGHSLFAELVASLLRQEAFVQVIELPVPSDGLADQVRQLAPDTIIVDSQDTGLNAHTLLSPLLDEHPNLRVLCLTMGQPCPHTCPARCTRVNTKLELVEAMAAKLTAA